MSLLKLKGLRRLADCQSICKAVEGSLKNNIYLILISYEKAATKMSMYSVVKPVLTVSKSQFLLST